jgi:hypothetical protein
MARFDCCLLAGNKLHQNHEFISMAQRVVCMLEVIKVEKENCHSRLRIFRGRESKLGQISQRVVLTVDNYEVLRLLDTWLRQEFVPAQPPNVHIVLC